MARYETTFHEAWALPMQIGLLLLVAVGSAALGFEPIAEVIADAATVLREEPSERALVYFINFRDVDNAGIFIDDAPVARLGRKSYVAFRLEPGTRLVWTLEGSRDWFDFQPGRSYLIQLPWLLRSSPDGAVFIAFMSGLQYMPPTAQDLEELEIFLRDPWDYSEFLSWVGEPTTVTLPHKAEKIGYFEPPFRESGGARGTMTVNCDKLVFQPQDGAPVKIPACDILSLSLKGYYRGTRPILGLVYGSLFQQDEAHFVVSLKWNVLFEAIEQARACCDSG